MRIGLITSAFLFAYGIPLLAQEPPIPPPGQDDAQRRAQEQEKLREMEKLEFYGESIDHFYFDYGAWLRPGWFSYHDGTGSEISQTDYDIRLWLDLRYGAHQLYARMVTDYSSYASGDGPDGDDHDFESPHGDVLFYQVQLGELLGEPDRTWDLTARAGRQYVAVGTGLVFNNIADGLTLRGNVGSVPFDLFALRLRTHADDIDLSRPNPDESKRYFFGGTLRYSGIVDQLPYLSVVIERDELEESPENEFQDYQFNAEYFGLGIQGKITDGLYYDFEGWYQTGERFAHLATDTPERVEAFAAVASLEYQFYTRTRPSLNLGVMFGSGDEDRYRILNTEFGNQIETDDKAFLGFGYIPTGYTLAPYLSNLWILHLGGSFNPFLEKKMGSVPLDSFEVALDFYYYRKHKKEGGISDPFADFEHADIGYAVDLSLNWDIFSDITFLARGGTFLPGAAYDTNDPRYYVSFSMLFSF